MASKDVAFGKDAREKVLKGIDTTADAVKLTIGAKGQNVFIDDPMQPRITNDGKTIAMAIELDDKFENLGAWLVKNTASQTDDDAGDGTSTTTVLLQAIIHEALKRPENTMDIKRSLEEASEKVVAMLKKESVPVKDDQIEQVATISSESKAIGKLIADIIAKIGKDSPIYIEDNYNNTEIESDVTEGLETRVGYVHPYFATTGADAVHENVRVFATDRKIGSLTDIMTLLTLCNTEKITSLVILVSDMENAVTGQFIANKMQGVFQSLIIRAKGTDLEDMAAACGATLISETTGIKFSDVKLEHLGKVKKIVANDRKTLIVAKDTPERAEYIEKLQALAASTKNKIDAENFKKRAEAIKGGIGIIRVGAHTDSERGYLKHKIEDAVNATKSALEEGLVDGGGMFLYRAAGKLKGYNVGEDILRSAMRAPLKAIIENSGKDYTDIVKRLYRGKGYNVLTGKFVDMKKEGIVDPAKVVRCALQNAVSSAATFITTGASMVDKKQDNETNK